MKWFEHDCDTSSDPKIKLLKKQFGVEGIGTYFEINRLISKAIEAHNIDEWGYLPTEYSDDLEMLSEEVGTPSVQRLNEIITLCKQRQLLFTSEKSGRLLNPKVLYRADRYTKDVCKKLNTSIEELVQKLYSDCKEYAPTNKQTIPYKQNKQTNHDGTNPSSTTSGSEIKNLTKMKEALKGKVLPVLTACLVLLAFPHSTHAKTIIKKTITVRSTHAVQAAPVVKSSAKTSRSLRENNKTRPKNNDRGVARVVEASEHTSVEAKIRAKFGKDGDIALAIAKAESGANPSRIGDHAIAYLQDGIVYGKSYGVFQIRHLPGRPSPDQLLTEDFNIEYAYNLYKRSGFSPWSAYTNGSYARFL